MKMWVSDMWQRENEELLDIECRMIKHENRSEFTGCFGKLEKTWRIDYSEW